MFFIIGNCPSLVIAMIRIYVKITFDFDIFNIVILNASS